MRSKCDSGNIYKNLNLENVMLIGDKCSIIDWDSAYDGKLEYAKCLTSTEAYVPPEIMKNDESFVSPLKN